MNASDEAELLRVQLSLMQAQAAIARTPVENRPALGKTKQITTYPTAAGAFYAVETQAITGNPVEGGAATYTGAGDTVMVYNIGGTAPPLGTYVCYYHVPFRKVMQYD